MKYINILQDATSKVYKKGFVLPLALLVCTIILAISTGISTILTKELFFSKLSRDSQVAYYAADDGMMCATMIDDTYVDPITGIGIFPYDPLVDGAVSIQNTLNQVNSQRAGRGYSSVSLHSIRCATSAIFDPSVTSFAVASYSHVNSSGVTENGRTSVFSMRMDLGGGATRCARIIVNKTATYRQIISRGFSNCGVTGLQTVERAVISTTELR